ncbi:Aste57867_1775 [Aphanomyces stellatus]|uniref:Aste57867_1775 protein n=1 Tax=Aphanomyces stellatus TaxID=120398 RepID=A0A485K716_9STRA|nr:hypothetical protein As57867_001773 [Aphanomyces stellatus]VFT78984.1 Aste57867_1775 [Aphanomyces stellatus]
MASCIQVLVTPEVFRLVSLYQNGIPEDFVPFAQLPRVEYLPQPWFHHDTKVFAGGNPAPHVDAVLLAWLGCYNLDRLATLTLHLPHLKATVLEFAAYNGRVDILQAFPPDEFASTANLLVLAALQGHIPVVEYLVHVGYKAQVNAAGGAAAWGGDIALLETMTTLNLDNWIPPSMFTYAARAGQLAAFEWLWQQWAHDQNYEYIRGVALRSGLDEAIRHGHEPLARWMAGSLREPTIRRIVFLAFLRQESHAADFLLEYMDNPDDVNLVLGMLISVTNSKHALTKVQSVLAVLDTTTNESIAGLTRNAESRILAGAAKRSFVDVIQWLVNERTMSRAVVRRIFEKTADGRIALVRAIRTERSEILLVLEGSGVAVKKAMTVELRAAVGTIPLALWLMDDSMPMRSYFGSTTLLDWMVQSLGGRVAVMGHELARLARPKTRGVGIFPSLFKAWHTRVVETTERDRVISSCLQGGCSPLVISTIALSFPSPAAFLLQRTESSPIRELRIELEIFLFDQATDEDKKAFEREMLFKATMARRRHVVAWLVYKCLATNPEAIERALNVADQLRWTEGLAILQQRMIEPVRCVAGRIGA